MKGEVQGGGVLASVGVLLFVQLVYETTCEQAEMQVWVRCLSAISTLTLEARVSGSQLCLNVVYHQSVFAV